MEDTHYSLHGSEKVRILRPNPSRGTEVVYLESYIFHFSGYTFVDIQGLMLLAAGLGLGIMTGVSFSNYRGGSVYCLLGGTQRSSAQ